MRGKFRSMTWVPILMMGIVAGCSSERDNFTPVTEAVVIGLGAEIIKTKIEQRLEITCNPLNLISDGSYCVSNYKPTDRQEVWCFKTLGGVDCYGEPDPYSLQGRALPAPPRALADPRMPMTPPGRRSPEQIAVAPVSQTQYEATDPVLVAPVGAPILPVEQQAPPAIPAVTPAELDRRLAM